MPLHDWTRVPAGLFHDFHQSWTVRIAQTLNGGLLPKDLSALLTRPFSTLAPDRPILVERGSQVALESDGEFYARLANEILIKKRLNRIIAGIEVVSPGNKDTKRALREFVDSTLDYLKQGIHVLIIDVFPPTPRDPFGLHKAIWDQIEEADFAFPPSKDRTLASYETGRVQNAFVEPVGIGDRLPDMPLFLANDQYIPVPLEPTYQATWDASPEGLREVVEAGGLPD